MAGRRIFGANRLQRWQELVGIEAELINRHIEQAKIRLRRLHRDNGSAHIERYTSGEIICEEWWRNGTVIRPRRAALSVALDRRKAAELISLLSPRGGRGKEGDCLTVVRFYRTPGIMRIRTVRHKRLKRFIEDDDDRGIRRDLVNRVRRVLTALLSVENIEGLEGPPGWRIHQLTGERAGTWSVSVSANWRITFEIDSGEIHNLDLEDYHG